MNWDDILTEARKLNGWTRAESSDPTDTTDIYTASDLVEGANAVLRPGESITWRVTWNEDEASLRFTRLAADHWSLVLHIEPAIEVDGVISEAAQAVVSQYETDRAALRRIIAGADR